MAVDGCRVQVGHGQVGDHRAVTQLLVYPDGAI